MRTLDTDASRTNLLPLTATHHHVPEGLDVFPVPWSSRWSWSLHFFLGRPTFLRPCGLYCSACFGILFVSILCRCCSHFFCLTKTNVINFRYILASQATALLHSNNSPITMVIFNCHLQEVNDVSQCRLFPFFNKSFNLWFIQEPLSTVFTILCSFGFFGHLCLLHVFYV